MVFRSQWVSFGFTVALPGVPVVNIDAVTYNTITLSASVTGASLGTTFEWQFLGQTAEPIDAPNTASGYNYIYTGLVPDTEYSFKVRTKNLSGVSPWVDVAVKTSLSDLLDYIDDIPLQKLSEDAQTLIEDINTQVDRLRPDTEDNIPDVLARTVTELNLEKQARTDIELSIFDLSGNYTAWRQQYEQRQLGNERLIDAAVYIDPENGTIVNRAFAYTDQAFTEANVLIDGVNASIELQANRITSSNERLSQAEANLIVQAGQITQRATFTEVRTEIAGAIEALTPAYSWHFNTTTEGFTGNITHNALGYVTLSGVVNTPALSYQANENPMLRLRFRKQADQPWLGNIYLGADQLLVNVLEPEGDSWETKNIDLSGIEGYTGEITQLIIDLGHVDIDFIEIGKRGANDLALNDITTRATLLENDIDAATGIMAQYATTTWVNNLGYQTQSNVNAILNTFDTTYQVSATLQSFNENGTLEKANNAQQFINGAEAYITSQITAFNAAEGSVNAQFATVEQKLDAINGTIEQSIVQIQGLDADLQTANLNDVILQANNVLQGEKIAEQEVKIALAQTELLANTDDLESVAQNALELATKYNQNLGLITELSGAFSNEQQASIERDTRYQATFESVTARFSNVTTAMATIDEANTVRDLEFESFIADTVSSFDEVAETFASQNQAFTTLENTLTSKIATDTAKGKSEAIATAQEYTRTAIGYCVDANGNITSQSDAVQCVTDGGSWVDGPLAEFIANLQISDGEESASIKQLRQLFKTVDGKLVARGGWTLDNNGRVSGIAGYNDGDIASLDFIGDVIRQGAMVGTTFVPTSYVDNSDPLNPIQRIKGILELGDGHTVASLEDIRAQDGLSAINFYTTIGEFEKDGINHVKQSATGWGNAGFSSKEYFIYATASARVSSTARVMVGLSASPSLGDYTKIPFAIYSNEGVLSIYESGNNRGNFGAVSGANRISVTWDGVSVRYYKDATLIYTSTATKPTTPLLFDVAVYGHQDIFAEPFFASAGAAGGDGAPGTRGSVEVQVATTSGVWYDSTANSAVPNGIPVTHDRVTIYKSSDPAVQTIKRFNGSNWVAYTLYVHGSAMIEDTLDAKVIRAGTKMTAPIIEGGTIRGAIVEMKGTNYMKIQSATPFGPHNLIEWYGKVTGNVSGSTVLYNNLTKTNAVTYVDDEGSPYFGGTIIAGTLTTSTQNPSTGSYVTLDTESFGSNGKQIAIVCSASSTGSSGEISGSCSTSNPDRHPLVTLQLYEVSSSGAETLVKVENGEGNYICSPEGSNRKIESYTLGKSFTYFDNKLSTADRKYRLKATFSNTFGSINQRISIVTQEA